MSKSMRLPREKRFELQKLVRDPGVLTILTSKSFSRRRGANFVDFNFPKLRTSQFLPILTSKSFSRAGVVQILAASTSVPTPSVFNDFDFQIVLARRRGANFADFNFQKYPKVFPHPQFLTILTSKSLSRAGVVQILSHLGQQTLRASPFLGVDFPSQRSRKTLEKHSTSRKSYPPNPHVTHLCCITSARSHLLVDRSSAATLSIVGS